MREALIDMNNSVMFSPKSVATTAASNRAAATFICIITDMTDPSNSCKRHVINLPANYSIEDLIQEAGNHYAYDPFTFCLLWKCHSGEMINVSEIQTSNLSLADLGLKGEGGKNLFEIHEKEEGPPKKLKSSTDASTSHDLDDIPSLEENCAGDVASPASRRNAVYSKLSVSNLDEVSTEYGPVNLSSNSVMSVGFCGFGGEEANEYVGLINQAMTCYLNSLIQTLYMTPEFRNGIYRWNYQGVINDDEEARKSIPYQLQRLFLNLQTSKKKSIHTQDLTKSFGWNNDDAFQQHDVQELCRVMFDALEKRFKGTRQENLINELYQGKVKDYVKCLECNTESARVDVFLDIPLCIRPFGSDKTFESVEAALDAFVQPEILDENNKYFCDKCNRMCKAHKGLKIDSFPYILSLQLKRFDFDYKTMSRFKLSNTVSFPEILNVEKYLRSDSESPDPPSADIETVAQADPNYDYELFSIMIHSGSATGGHYYAYIKSFETNQWYNFNDERVSKIDREDIIKAYGHSYSTYSSTTAYMLLYRLKNEKRNEKFIRIDEFDEHLTKLLERERNQQLEADRLKEYMENVCKIKVVVPASSQQNGTDASIARQRTDKVLEIHKDLTLEMAKEQIIREFELPEYLKQARKKARILKYDSHNDLIEQSYTDESKTTVFEALGFTKYAYNVNWLLEVVDEDENFVEYNSNDCSVKVCHVDMVTFETRELFTVRLASDSSVYELRERIAQKLPGSTTRLRMALEKLHTLYNYVYLNNNLGDSLRQMNFARVNKLFVDWSEDEDNGSFETSKFYYALDSIINMLNMVVYLPTKDQCDLFVKKTHRHKVYIENKRRLLAQTSQTTNINTDDNTLDSYENLPSVQSSTRDVFNSSTNIPTKNIDINLEKKIAESMTVEEDDSVSKMSFQEASVFNQARKGDEFPLIENHFKDSSNMGKQQTRNELNLNDMETSLDEGIGSSGSLSTNNLKNSPNSSIKLSPIASNPDESTSTGSTKTITKLVEDLFSYESESNGVGLDYEAVKQNYNYIDRCLDDVADLDVNVDDNEENHIESDNESRPTTPTLDGPGANSNMEITNHLSFDPPPGLENMEEKFLKFEEPFWDDNIENPCPVTYPSDSMAHKNAADLFDDTLPKYSDIKHKFESSNLQQPSGDIYLDYFSRANEDRYIKSELIVNEELSTRTLEIKMDKRMDLGEFKSHVDEYLKIGVDNFRVVRLCPNDLECELSAGENLFLYLANNSKFLIKLGPPLKYGEYVLPVYMLNKSKGHFKYLCDFMCFHGLSVLDHKEMLVDDLKDECEIEVRVEKMRVRKKISKRPGAILLDHEVFGTDIFVNAMTELCIEILEEPEKKHSKQQISVYLRHWKPDEYELDELKEVIVDGNSFDLLLSVISELSSIRLEDIEVLKCKRDYPFNSPILDLHKDMAWKDNYYLQHEKLEDGACFYYRNKTLKLGTISEEKKKEMEKEDNLNFRPTGYSIMAKKETGIKII